MSKNLKVVLLTEKSSYDFKVVDKANYILEGIFAIFGKENANQRIYDEDEYLPHLEYLQEKIKRNKLAGELDHPEKFDVSLSNISHIVEKIWYDKDSRTIKGRIRLLDTDPAGLNARKLVDAGFPISISSRAAGVVKEDKSVKIKRIFTYDLVADGGFGNDAELARVYESAGIIEKNELTLLNNEIGFKNNDRLKIYDVTDKYPELIEEDADFSVYDYSISKKNKSSISLENINEIYNKNNQSNMRDNKNKESVTVEEMHTYSLHVKEEMAKFESAISNINKKLETFSELINTNESIDKITIIEQDISNLQKYSNELSNDLFNTINNVELIDDKYKNIVENHNYVVNYAEKIAEDHNYIAGYVNEQIRPLLEKNIAYSEKIAEQTNYGLNYTEDVLAKALNETRVYVNDVLADSVNKLWNYQDYLSEKMNDVYNYAEYLGENAATIGDLEKVANFTESISEKYSHIDTNINEHTNTKNETILSKYSSLGDKIDNMLESIKTQRMNPINEHIKKYPFLKEFDGDHTKKFFSFTDVQKQQFAKSIDKNNQLNKDEISALFENVSLESSNTKPSWLVQIPEEYKETWKTLDESIKSRINAQSKLYPLNTTYQIANFWNTRGLNNVESDSSLNEIVKNQKAQDDEFTSSIGYSKNYMNNIKASLDKFNC